MTSLKSSQWRSSDVSKVDGEQKLEEDGHEHEVEVGDKVECSECLVCIGNTRCQCYEIRST